MAGTWNFKPNHYSTSIYSISPEIAMPRAKIQKGSKNIKDRPSVQVGRCEESGCLKKSPRGNPLSLSVSLPAATELSERRSTLVSQQWQDPEIHCRARLVRCAFGCIWPFGTGVTIVGNENLPIDMILKQFEFSWPPLSTER